MYSLKIVNYATLDFKILELHFMVEILTKTLSWSLRYCYVTSKEINEEGKPKKTRCRAFKIPQDFNNLGEIRSLSMVSLSKLHKKNWRKVFSTFHRLAFKWRLFQVYSF